MSSFHSHVDVAREDGPADASLIAKLVRILRSEHRDIGRVIQLLQRVQQLRGRRTPERRSPNRAPAPGTATTGATSKMPRSAAGPVSG
jgi:hypothetical protein